MIGPFPTPPSSASTPPISAPMAPASDDLPPRKRARYDPPPVKDNRHELPAPIGDAPLYGTVQEVGNTTEVKLIPNIRRIKIKMSASLEPRRTSTRLSKRNQSEDEYGSTEADDDDTTTPTQGSQDLKENWDDYEIHEMVDPAENWRVIGLSNVGNTCFSNAILQVFGFNPLLVVINRRQTEILREFFIDRYPYIPPPLTSITNPFTSADLTSRSSRSKTRRNLTEQDPPPLSSRYPSPIQC